MSEVLRSSSSDSSPPSTPTVIRPPLSWDLSVLQDQAERDGCSYQKKRGRPRMDDREVVEDESTPDAEKLKIIYKRKYARNYREKIRADLTRKEELRQMLQTVEEENKKLRETLHELRQENDQILANLMQTSPLIQSLKTALRDQALLASALQLNVNEMEK